jgi:hypothetical protein
MVQEIRITNRTGSTLAVAVREIGPENGVAKANVLAAGETAVLGWGLFPSGAAQVQASLTVSGEVLLHEEVYNDCETDTERVVSAFAAQE